MPENCLTYPSGSETSLILYEHPDCYGKPITAPNGSRLDVVDASFKRTQANQQSTTLRETRAESRPTAGQVALQGTINTMLGARQQALLLKHLFGHYEKTGSAGSYVHTFGVGALTNGLLAEQDFGTNAPDGGRYIASSGLRINTMGITVPLQGPIACAVGFEGMDQDPPSNTPLDATPTNHGGSEFDSLDATVYMDGVAAASISGLSTINFNNNLAASEGYVYNSGGVRQALPGGKFAVSGGMDLIYSDTSFIEKARNRDTFSLRVDLSLGNGDGSADNEMLSIVLQKVIFEPSTPEVTGPAGIKLSSNFTAFADAADDIQIILRNGVDYGW